MKMVRLLLVAFCCSTLNPLRAQVPQLINFQGRVAVDGVNFNGTGQFKFVLVNGDGSVSFWSDDGTSVGGSEPTNAVSIAVSQALYSILLGNATLTNITPISAAIFTNSDVRLRIWFNDGTNGFQQLSPDQRIAAVGYAMMAANVADGVVTSAKLANGAVTGSKLAVGAVTATNIAPHSIGAAQLATNAAADSLHDSGGLVLSDQANARNLLNAGYVRIGQVTTDVDNWQLIGSAFPTVRQTAVWTGSEMIIWGYSAPVQGTEANRGTRFNPVTGIWTPVTMNGAPSPRSLHTAIWTGSEMIVWGGLSPITLMASGLLQTGGRYDPVSDRWQPTSTSNAPAARHGHTAVWTGSEMIVWGGATTNQALGTGARYDPTKGTWRPISMANAPGARSDHTAIWNGTEMIVWGGLTSFPPPNIGTGGRYDPVTDRWTATATNSAPGNRAGHTAVWTGSEMIVWGGSTYFQGAPAPSGNQDTGGRYRPLTDSWTPTPVTPTGRIGHTAVWTGSEMIIWGGTNLYYNSTNTSPALRSLGTGARFNPVTGTWTPVSTNNAPTPRQFHDALWTGSEMIVWGGLGYTQLTNRFSVTVLNTGGRYNPATDRWLETEPLEAPQARMGHTAIWTGDDMIIWGGVSNGPTSDLTRYLNTGARYDPLLNSWTTVASTGAPSARANHTAVWTGKEMIVWSGIGPDPNFNDPRIWAGLATGARYDPSNNTWKVVSTNGARFTGQSAHAFWTGNEMIVAFGSAFGQQNPGPEVTRYQPDSDRWLSVSRNDRLRFGRVVYWTGDNMLGLGRAVAWTGKELIIWDGQKVGRYNPATDTWTGRKLPGSPADVVGATAVWTGESMLIFGGSQLPTSRPTYPNDVYAYSLTQLMYLYRKP